MKGTRNSECNRNACRNAPAIGYHFGNYAWYCRECSHDINRLNTYDAIRLYNLTFIIAIEGEVTNDEIDTLKSLGYYMPDGLTKRA